MTQKFAIFLIALLALPMILPVSAAAQTNAQTNAQANADREARRAATVRRKLTRIAVADEGRIVVRMRDGNRLKGTVSEVRDDVFVFRNDETGVVSQIDYRQVKAVKARSRYKPADFLIGGAAAAILVLYGVVGPN